MFYRWHSSLLSFPRHNRSYTKTQPHPNHKPTVMASILFCCLNFCIKALRIPGHCPLWLVGLLEWNRFESISSCSILHLGGFVLFCSYPPSGFLKAHIVVSQATIVVTKFTMSDLDSVVSMATKNLRVLWYRLKDQDQDWRQHLHIRIEWC